MSVRHLGPELPDPQRGIRPRSPAEMLEPSRAPARPKGRRKRRESGSFGKWVRFTSSILTVLVIMLLAFSMAFFVLQHQYTTPGPLAEERTIIIPRGEGRLEIAKRLENEGIITNRWSFIVNHLVHSYLLNERLDMKAGEFKIAQNASMEQVLKTIVHGKSVQYRITLPEGLTSQQIVGRVLADENLTGDVTAIPLEGSLLPDTYPYERGADRQAILDRMANAQTKFVEGLWEKRQEGLPINSMEEALILASIVEKETAVAEERAMTAAVFMNRLRKGMRLQSDPTIIYGIVGGKGSLGRSITKSDIQTKTIYNTYTINGLPPTPICNPGREAILAVLNPAATNALFFVADGTGGHKFSETYAEHRKAVAEWRRIEREQKKQAQSKPASPVTTVAPTNANPPQAEPAPVTTTADAPPVATPPPETSSAQEATVSGLVVPPGGMPLPDRKPQ
ncbi:MAG: endolytic transglycosylase MltG [Filomicrobium sp.]